MNTPSNPSDPQPGEPPAGVDGNTITPLPGELGIPNVAARQTISWSRKGLLAVALLVLSLILEAKARGAAILGIFHDEGARARVCDRLVDVTGFHPAAAAA